MIFSIADITAVAAQVLPITILPKAMTLQPAPTRRAPADEYALRLRRLFQAHCRR